jgi:hypothetical protein
VTPQQIAAALSLALFASIAQAQVYIAGPKGCALVAGLSDGGIFHALDEDHLIFDGTVLEGIEWHCAFEPAFAPVGRNGDIQIRAGYCMEPGPIVDPQVFSLFDRGDGTAQLDATIWTDPLILEICQGP